MSSSAAARPTISFVIPVYNEEAVLPLLFVRLEALAAVIAGEVEFLFVDDGSRDASGRIIAGRSRNDARFRYVALSRNFGHQAAITAGVHLARGDAVIIMDADLQDPPEVALELIAKWRDGFEIIHARRRHRSGETLLKNVTARLFYRTMRALSQVDIPIDVGDFKLIDRKAVETFCAMPERDRYVRGMFGWMGYRQTTVDFDRDSRAAGVSKYNWPRMARLALNGIVSFSDLPLRLGLWAGAAISAAALLYGCVIMFSALVHVQMPGGWPSLAVLISFLAGSNMLMTGFVGLYVGRIHGEVKNRPLYVVAHDSGAPVSDSRTGAMPARLAVARAS